MRFVVLIYAILILAGGIIGHAKAASTASLVMGVVFGVLLLTASIGMFKRTSKRTSWGGTFALILTLLLDAFFTYRFVQTGKFMPSGMLSLVSLIVMVLLALHIRSKPSQSSIK
jgi:uncharacterized membrane protein (UPF0136 family)